MKLSALVRGLKRHASRAAGFVAVAIGAAALIGWWTGVPTLSSWGSGFATAKPTTALCVAALGLALVHPGKDSRLAFGAGLAVAAIGTLDLLDQFGIDIGINHLNRLLVPRAEVPGPETSFRMINGVPVALTLAGGSLALSRFERYHFAATALGVLAGVMQVFALLAYLSDGHRFYSSVWMPTPMTAVGLLCLAIAIVSRIGAMPALRKPRPLWHLLIMLGYAIIAPLLLFGLYTGILLMAELRGAAARRHAAEHDLQASKDQLQASKDRLQLALNAALLGWWQYDPLRRVILADTRLKEIFDFTDDETLLEEFAQRVHPDDLQRVWADREAALNPADPKPYAHEYRIRRRDGELRWVDAHGLAYFEGAGRDRRAVSFIGTVADITQRKEREERERLLMREVSHRAKNMLSVVDAIAHQTATRNPEDFIERFSERIQALAANQDLLIRSEWHGVEVEDLVCAQLAPFADLIGSRIMVRGPKGRLRAAGAQAIGLALHELATNAGKYGRSRRIRVVLISAGRSMATPSL